MLAPNGLHKDLAPYQAEAAGWLLLGDNRILADDMGVGKTFEMIAAADLLSMRRVLVVCPGIARHNWLEEIDKWSLTRRSREALFGSKDIKNIATADSIVVSYSLLRSVKVLKALLMRRWDVLILDEAHLAKSNEAWRTRAIYGMKCDAANGLASVSDRVWVVSGTLMPNNPSELWTHVHALFPDVCQGMGFNRWVNEYCVSSPVDGRIVGAKNTDRLVKLLKPHVLRRLSKDVLPQLPPLRFSHVPVRPESLPPMSVEVKETAKVVDDAIRKLESRGAGIEKVSAAVDAMDKGGVATLRKWTAVAKAPAIAEYIIQDLEAGMDKLVVFGWHREPMDIIHAAVPGSEIINGSTPEKKREGYLSAFKDPTSSLKVLILQVEIANAAINLVSAHNVIFVEPPWVPMTLEQAIARLRRKGQTQSVWARLFSLQGSYDEKVMRILTRKMATTSRFNSDLTTRIDK